LSGARRIGQSGQLALMDALVFFMVAMAISSILLYYSSSGITGTQDDHGQGMSDPHEILGVLLRSSIGREITVSQDVPRHISWDNEVSVCLLLEAEAIVDGMPPEAFDELNDAVLDLLRSLCNPVYEPFLSVMAVEDSGTARIVSIPGVPVQSNQMYAATMDLVQDEEKSLLAQLVLRPAALPEVA
jgi:hypothetical protein